MPGNAAGVDIVRLDERWLQSRPGEAAKYGGTVIDRRLTACPPSAELGG